MNNKHPLLEFFKRHSITQKEVAGKLKYSEKHINKVLNGLYPCNKRLNQRLYNFAKKIDKKIHLDNTA